MRLSFYVVMNLFAALEIQRNGNIAATVFLVAFSHQKLIFRNIKMSCRSVIH